MRIIYCIFVLVASASFAASPIPPKEDPLAQLNTLISSTEKLVARQKNLKNLLDQYIALRDQYLLDTNNRELALKTAKIAELGLDIIKTDHLAYLFEPSFVSEMTLFAKLAERPSIPKLP